MKHQAALKDLQRGDRPKDVAERYGLAPETVYNLRRYYGLPRSSDIREAGIIKLLDTHTDQQIADAFALSLDKVARVRRRIQGRRGSIIGKALASTDWSKTDAEIALENGCHQSSVAYWRKKYAV